MTTDTITTQDLIKRYADEMAYVAEEDKATTLSELADQLDTAATRFDQAYINGHEDLQTAATLLSQAGQASDDTARAVFLQGADDLLYPIVWDMTQEYRLAAGD